jgi:hypothetical protein
MKWFLLAFVSLVISACQDAGASSEPADNGTVQVEQVPCKLVFTPPAYFVGESCPQADYLMQGIQAVTQNGQTYRGVRCVKLQVSCKP